MAQIIEALDYSFEYRNGSFFNTTVVSSLTCTLSANSIGTMTVILASDVGIVKEDDIDFKCWYRSAPGNVFNPGKYYVDSWQKVNEYFRLDAINIDYVTNPYGSVTYTDQTITQIVNDVSTEYSVTPVLPTIGASTIVGLAPTSAGPNTITSDSSKIDALFVASDLYAFFSYIYGGNLYCVAFEQYFADAGILIEDAELLALERNHNTIDTVKTVDGIRWRLPSTGVFSPANVNYVEYGKTFDATSEGFNYNINSATRRYYGVPSLNCKDVRLVRVKTFGRIGTGYLPGRKLRVGRQDGTADNWVIRSHTWNFSASGFTSDFILQLPSFYAAA